MSKTKVVAIRSALMALVFGLAFGLITNWGPQADATAPATTQTSLQSSGSDNPQPTNSLTAIVSGLDEFTDGLVHYTLDGSPIRGCSTLPIDSRTHRSTCSTVLPIGDHTVSVTYEGDDNFATSSATIFLHVRYNLTYRGPTLSRSLGTQNPVLSPSYDGFIDGDDASDLSQAPACSTTAGLDSPIGDYHTSCTPGSDSKYRFQYGGDGVLTIIPVIVPTGVPNQPGGKPNLK